MKIEGFCFVILLSAVCFGQFQADLNVDGIVDFRDFALFTSEWLKIDLTVCCTGHWRMDDNVRWVRYQDNPILDVGAVGDWDDTNIVFPEVIKVGSVYYMYYSGGVSNTVEYTIGLATSADGRNFSRITDGINGTSKVLEKGPPRTWEDSRVWSSCLVYHNDIFYMFYTGRSVTGDRHGEQIGLAISTDGKNWTKYSNNPILKYETNDWNFYQLCHCDVAWDQDNSKWVMLVSGVALGAHESIGRYYCSEEEFPVTWTEDANNPVIDYNTQECDAWHVYHPEIYPQKVGGKWYVYYTAARQEGGGR